MGPNLNLALPGAAAPHLLPGFPFSRFLFCPFPAPRCWHGEDGQCHPGAVGSVLPTAPLSGVLLPPPTALLRWSPARPPALSRGRVLWSRGCRRGGQDQTLLSTRHCHELGSEPCGAPPGARSCLPAGARLLVPSRPVLSHPVPSSLIPSHPTAHSGTPHRENHRHGPGQVGSQHARSRPCWQRGRGRPRGAPSSPPAQRAAGTGTSADPGGQGTCASCGRVSANAHSARLLPGFAAVSGDDRAVPRSWLFVLSANRWHATAAGRSGPACGGSWGDAGAAAVARNIPRSGGAGGTKSRAEMSPRKQPPLRSPWSLHWGAQHPARCGGPGDTEQRPDPARLPASKEAPNPCGLPGKPQPRGCRGRAASLGASTRCWEPWGAGACPGSPQTTQKTEGRSRLTHGRVLGAEISRPSAALTLLPQPVPAALAWVSARSLGAKAQGPGLGRVEEGGAGSPPAPCAANTGTRESPGRALAVPLHPSRRQGAAQR